MRFDSFTRFITRHVPGVSHDSLCFGDPVRLVAQGKRTTHYFRPGQLFGVVWWRRSSQDQQFRTLAVVEGLPTGAAGGILPGIDRAVAVHALATQEGPAGQDGVVDHLLDLLDDMQSAGRNPAEYPAEFWSQTAQYLLLSPILELDRRERVLCLD